MPAPALASVPSSWIPVAVRGGVVAGLLGGAALALGYFLAHPDVPALHSWPVTVTAILGAGALSGVSLALSVCGGLAIARRRGGGTMQEVLWAAGGGVVGSLLPGAIGVLGFGSLSTPYIGTDVAAVGVLVAALLLGTLLSLPAATNRAFAGSRGAALGCSALASILVIVPFGVTLAGIVASELPFPVIRQILRFLRGADADYVFAAVALTIGLAVVFGAIVGAFIGLAGNLAALLRRGWSVTRRPGDARNS
jgi:hypothetical protein